MGLDKHNARSKSDRPIAAIEALTAEVQELRAVVLCAQAATADVSVQVQQIAAKQ